MRRKQRKPRRRGQPVSDRRGSPNYLRDRGRRREGGDQTFKYLAEGKGATVTARFGSDELTICDPNRASEGVDKVFQRDYLNPV